MPSSKKFMAQSWEHAPFNTLHHCRMPISLNGRRRGLKLEDYGVSGPVLEWVKSRDLRIVFFRSNRISNRIGRPIRFRIEYSNRIGRIPRKP